MKEKQNSLAHLLREMRLERGLSLRQFSEHLGISHAYLDKLEKGADTRTGKEISPTIDVVRKLARNVKIPPRTFFKMCGYFEEETSLAMHEPQEGVVFDITEEFEELKIAMIISESIMYNGVLLNKEVRETVTTYLDNILEALGSSKQ